MRPYQRCTHQNIRIFDHIFKLNICKMLGLVLILFNSFGSASVDGESLTFDILTFLWGLKIKSVHCTSNKISSQFVKTKIVTIFVFIIYGYLQRDNWDIYAWVCQNSGHLHHWFAENVALKSLDTLKGFQNHSLVSEPTLKYFRIWVILHIAPYQSALNGSLKIIYYSLDCYLTFVWSPDWW